MLVVNIILVILYFTPYGLTCLPTSAPDSVIPVEAMLPTVTALTTLSSETPPTTAPPRTCPEVSDMAAAFMASNVESQLTDAVYGAVSPVTTCTTCANGMVNYYDSASTDVPHSSPPLESAGSLTATSCPEMCICGTDGTCYTTTDNSVVATLWPYCNAGTCGTYVLITGNDDSGFVSTSGSPTFTVSAQYGTDLPYKPVTDPSYINAATISCESCVPSICQTMSN